MKSSIIAAAAVTLAVGVVAVAGTSLAGPKTPKFNPGCWPGFVGSNFTSCSKTFHTTCKKGFSTTGPTLTHIGNNKWRVSYGCYVIK